MNLVNGTKSIVDPISEQQQKQVVDRTQFYIEKASLIFAREFEIIPILFDLKGCAVGMYRVRGCDREIRYNPYVFAKYFVDNLAVTVPHEVAHYIMDRVYGLRKVKAHGAEWRELMGLFDADAKATCSYDLAGIPLKREQRFSYRCACRTHLFTTRRHNQAQKSIARYRCRNCGDTLIASQQVS